MQEINWNNNKLSKLCLGTVQFGMDYGIANEIGQVNQKEVNEIIDFVLSNGINCFDTAKGYGNSETVIGKYFKNLNDDNINIISKVKSELFSSSENLSKEISKSLSKINTNRLFGLLLHDSDVIYNWDESYSKNVKELKKKELIKYFGVSIYTDEEFELAIDNKNIELIQIPFNLFDQRAISKKWLEKAKNNNKLIFIRSVYLQGLILMDFNKIPENLNDVKPYIKILDDTCKKLNITKNELALGFVNSIASDSIILFGCDKLEQAKENLENFNKSIVLENDIIDDLKNTFSSIEEKIYNPTKWKVK
ncbi:MAG: aldo/keto reductase [Campylobacterota bacterium]|nr:aldo/keto reductase [Campylobacterota bacterium]